MYQLGDDTPTDDTSSDNPNLEGLDLASSINPKIVKTLLVVGGVSFGVLLLLSASAGSHKRR